MEVPRFQKKIVKGCLISVKMLCFCSEGSLTKEQAENHKYLSIVGMVRAIHICAITVIGINNNLVLNKCLPGITTILNFDN